MAENSNYDLEEDMIPVFLINGFLEAGKTDFIRYTMRQDYFQTKGRTLLLLCEEGESEYDEAGLRECNTVLVPIQKVSDLNSVNLKALEDQYKPERVIIEWNGMWNQDDLYDGPMSEKVLAKQQGRKPGYEVSLPDSWSIYQVITIIDGSTLPLYLGNMKPFLGQMLRQSEMVIVNRCDDIAQETLTDYRRKIRAMGQNASIILEGKDGEIPQDTLPEDLPYDINGDKIDILPEDYGIWFVDCMDNPDRYVGKKVTFSAMVLKRAQMPDNEFVPGRMAMTCCAQDMTFLGFVCKGKPKEIAPYRTRDWVKITARVEKEYREEYHGEGPVLDLDSIARTGEIKEPAGF